MDPVHLYRYLALARERVFGWIDGMPDADYRREHDIGLRSLARTLHHIKGAEWAYVERISGRGGPLGEIAPENNADVATDDAMAFDQLRSTWRAQAEATMRTLEAVSDWATPVVRETTWEGRPYRYSASADDFFAQLVMHEVHHRAQVLHMLRRLGVDVGDVDYNALMWPEITPNE